MSNAMNETDGGQRNLNEMQRNAGGDTVTEDESRYQVTVHLPGATSASDWTGEVVGPPQLFVLKTVNVVAAGKTVDRPRQVEQKTLAGRAHLQRRRQWRRRFPRRLAVRRRPVRGTRRHALRF